MFAIGMENRLLFGIVMLFGGVSSLSLGWYRCAKAKVMICKRVWATVLLPLFIMFFSHLFYALVNVEDSIERYSIGYLFAFWENGMMIYGGMLGGVLALLYLGGKGRLKMLEAYAPGGAWMIAMVRIGEGFLGQGYGEYVEDVSFFQRFPFMVYDSYYEAWGWALFVIEALVALALFVFLLSRKQTWPADGALLLFGLYASVQIVLESLRRDEFLRRGFVRVEEVISAAVILAVLVCYCKKASVGRRLSKFLCFGLCVGMIILCMLLEFALEGRISFLTFLDVNACYGVMSVACLLLGGCVLWMRRLCNKQIENDRRK